MAHVKVIRLDGVEATSGWFEMTSHVSDILEKLYQEDEFRICTLLREDVELDQSLDFQEAGLIMGDNLLSAIFWTSAGLASRGLTISMLKEATPSAKVIRVAKNLKAAGYTAKELRSSGYTLSEMRTAGCTMLELLLAGYPLADFNRDGISLKHLKGSLQAVFGEAPESILEALRGAGYTLRELMQAGYSIVELRKIGKMLPTFTMAEFLDAGYTLRELREGHFTAAEIKAAGFPVRKMKEAGYTASEMKEADFPAGMLKLVGYSLLQVKQAGYSIEELREAGYTAWVLGSSGYSSRQLKSGGFATEELIDAGFLPAISSSINGTKSIGLPRTPDSAPDGLRGQPYACQRAAQRAGNFSARKTLPAIKA